MRAMVLREYKQPLQLCEIAEPELGPLDAVVRVRACGICRTDVKLRDGEILPTIIKLPHVMGHEAAGEVVAVGEQVTCVKPGDRVVVYLYVTCGNCEHCRSGRENLCPQLGRVGFELQGAFAEFIVVPAKQLLKIGDAVSFEKAAVLTDAVVVPYHAIRNQAKVAVGDTVLIVGIGGLGIHAVQIARLAGARVIAADISEERLALARELGAHHTVNSIGGDPLEEVRQITGGMGVDAVIENVGAPETLTWSLPATKKGGKLIIVGYSPGRPFPLDTMAMHYNEWEIIGSRLATKQSLADVAELLNRGEIRPWVTKTFALEQADEALDQLAQGTTIGRSVLLL